MSNNIINVTITLLGKPFVIKCAESEAESLQAAADLLDSKMSEVQDSGKTINFERIAVITALNIAHQYLQFDNQKNGFIYKINQRIAELHDKIESALNKPLETELVYFSE